MKKLTEILKEYELKTDDPTEAAKEFDSLVKNVSFKSKQFEDYNVDVEFEDGSKINISEDENGDYFVKLLKANTTFQGKLFGKGSLDKYDELLTGVALAFHEFNEKQEHMDFLDEFLEGIGARKHKRGK